VKTPGSDSIVVHESDVAIDEAALSQSVSSGPDSVV
jgi:hypothetical protein